MRSSGPAVSSALRAFGGSVRSRRQFVSLLGRGAAATVLALVYPGVASVEAVAPAVVVAAISACLKVAEMLSPKGPSVQDLLRLQMQMLQVISLQLVEIQKGINLILDRLDELRVLVVALPSSTVMSFHKTQIYSLMQVYQEKMQAYAATTANSGAASAQKIHATDIRDRIVYPLSTSRAAFTSPAATSTYMDVPTVASAMQIELHSMIMAGYGRADLEAVVSSYSNWFLRMRSGTSGSIQSEMKRLRNARSGLTAKLQEPRSSRCFWSRDVHLEPGIVTGSRDERTVGPKRLFTAGSVRLARYTYTADARPLEQVVAASEVDTLRKNLDALLAAGQIQSSELPVSVRQVISARNDNVTVHYDEMAATPNKQSTDQNWIPLSELDGSFLQAMAECPQTEPFFPMSSEIKAVADELETNSSLLMLHASLNHAAGAALTALERFRQEIQALA